MWYADPWHPASTIGGGGLLHRHSRAEFAMYWHHWYSYSMRCQSRSLARVRITIRISRRRRRLLHSEALHHLDYKSPGVIHGGRLLFRTTLALFAALGILANLGLIGLLTQQLHQIHWIHHDLMQNPRAYGREIDPLTIASLRDRRELWAASGAFGLGLAFGLLLAVHLLVAAVSLARSDGAGVRRLSQYRRWKPLGVVLTVVTYIWAGNENDIYWAAATRHIPLGSGPPIIETAVLVACAMIPWCWLGNDNEDSKGEDSKRDTEL